jgi:hypothetical protein
MCMSVCAHAHVYVCICECVWIYVNVCVCVCVYVCTMLLLGMEPGTFSVLGKLSTPDTGDFCSLMIDSAWSILLIRFSENQSLALFFSVVIKFISFCSLLRLLRSFGLLCYFFSLSIIGFKLVKYEYLKLNFPFSTILAASWTF